MELNIIQKIFPPVDNQLMLKYNAEGIWSISLPSDAELITNIIKKNTFNCKTIFDGTGGLGGNVISFSKNFDSVIACEINKTIFEMLENNLDIFNIKNGKLIHDNCINNLDINADVYFFDPPWGGPNYKFNDKITIELGGYNLIQVIEKIRKNNNSPIFMKLPINYDLDEFYKFNYNIDKIKNYILITIF